MKIIKNVLVLLAVSIGCAGCLVGGYGGGEVVARGPDMYVFGGDYGRGGDVRGYSNRGMASRAVAHPGGGRGSGRR
jgi:hypothetical protein